jgi:hypothetical protein
LVVASAANGDQTFAGLARFSISAAHDHATTSEKVSVGADEACLWATDPVEGVVGQPTSVAYSPRNELVVQTREPAALFVYAAGTISNPSSVHLNAESAADSGHDLFHANAGGFVACASCHPESGDDGLAWNFEGVGIRRTQNLRGGILQTAPFHWEGDLQNLDLLMTEVFSGRMGGALMPVDYIEALGTWIDAQPALTRTGGDAAAIERGKGLFESLEVGCSECHSGALLTNNETENVGTGLELQVPSLLGVSFRAPFMHDGCAPTLDARFSDCGGGDLHGKTSQLSDADRSDLVVYLESL